jgi:AbiV family abortive infection protein
VVFYKALMALEPDAESLTQTLIDGVSKTCQNADELYREALHLAEMGATARALLLHQISLEECGKAHMLCVAVFALLRGEKVDMKRLARAFSRHEAKNRTNAYFLPRSASEVEAEQNNDAETASAAFKETQDRFHEESNDLKNASLYVNFTDCFTAPRDAISSDHLAEIRQRNADFVAMTHDKASMLTKWTANLDSAADEVAQMSAALGLDALDRNDPQTLEDFKTSLAGKLAELARR